MVRRLLDFARQDLSELKVLSLNAVVREEVLLLERTTLAQVRFAVELDDDLRAICGDYGALLHALMNLCVNAIDAMPGGGTLTVRTRNAEPGWVELEVVDTGVGMPAEVVEKAMDPFFTTKSHGKGTGLGLSIAYGTVRAHQGTMTLESAPGRGTRVVLRLPSTDITASDSEAPAAPGPEGNARRLDVLLVDDDELIRAAMGPVIQSLGHRVVLTGNAEEALEHLATGERPDVVILDMNMPGLGGKRALPRIRELQPGVPVLLATGRADQEAVDLAQAQPGVTLVPKPISTGELKAHLDAIPDRRPA
jgi:CheY-like chemotaxis protein/anti-sigma regulatory factor (Ser/Thr protein kinase)